MEIKTIDLIKNEVTQALIKKGVVSVKYKQWIDIYNYYQEECRNNPARRACSNTAERFNIAIRTVFYIKERMER